MSIHTLSVQNQLTYCLAALSDNDFAGSVLHERHLTKLISERLLKTRNGLMIYNKIRTSFGDNKANSAPVWLRVEHCISGAKGCGFDSREPHTNENV